MLSKGAPEGWFFHTTRILPDSASCPLGPLQRFLVGEAGEAGKVGEWRVNAVLAMLDCLEFVVNRAWHGVAGGCGARGWRVPFPAMVLALAGVPAAFGAQAVEEMSSPPVAEAPSSPAEDAPGQPAAEALRPPPMELTLEDGIALALKNNRRLIQSGLERTVQKFALRVAEDKFRPDARINSFRTFETEGEGGGWTYGSTGVSYQVSLRIPTGGEFALTNSVVSRSDGQRRTGYDGALRLSFTQPLLKGGGIAVNRASVKLARLQEEINILVFERTIEDVVASAVRAYRNLIRARQRLEISARSLQRTQELLSINQLLIETGRMAKLEVVQTEADVASRELSLIEAENALDAARLALIDILDIDSHTQLQPKDALDITPIKPDMESSLAQALEHRPDYLQALLRMESAEHELLLARNNRLWDLSATLSADVAEEGGGIGNAIAESFRGLDDGRYRAGLVLNIPLGDLTLRQRLLSAQTAVQRNKHSLAELRQSIEIAVLNAVREVEVRLRQVDLARRARQLVERKLDTERGKLRLGLSTNFQMILFEDDLVRAQESDLNAAIAYLDALTRLDQTLGTTLQTWGIDVERM